MQPTHPTCCSQIAFKYHTNEWWSTEFKSHQSIRWIWKYWRPRRRRKIAIKILIRPSIMIKFRSRKCNRKGLDTIACTRRKSVDKSVLCLLLMYWASVATPTPKITRQITRAPNDISHWRSTWQRLPRDSHFVRPTRSWYHVPFRHPLPPVTIGGYHPQLAPQVVSCRLSVQFQYKPTKHINYYTTLQCWSIMHITSVSFLSPITFPPSNLSRYKHRSILDHCTGAAPT